jgi:hypothetical protein
VGQQCVWLCSSTAAQCVDTVVFDKEEKFVAACQHSMQAGAALCSTSAAAAAASVADAHGSVQLLAGESGSTRLQPNSSAAGCTGY